MNDLMAKLEAAIAETEMIALAAIEGGRCDYPTLHDHANWLAPSRGDVASCGTILVFADYPDERVVEHIIRNDPDRVLRRVARDRKLLELHSPVWEHVEWPHAATGTTGDDRGKNWVCSSCRPAEPTDWEPVIGEAGTLPEGFVPSYTLAPCPTLRLLAEDYEIEVSDHV